MYGHHMMWQCFTWQPLNLIIQTVLTVLTYPAFLVQACHAQVVRSPFFFILTSKKESLQRMVSSSNIKDDIRILTSWNLQIVFMPPTRLKSGYMSDAVLLTFIEQTIAILKS